MAQSREWQAALTQAQHEHNRRLWMDHSRAIRQEAKSSCPSWAPVHLPPSQLTQTSCANDRHLFCSAREDRKPQGCQAEEEAKPQTRCIPISRSSAGLSGSAFA